MTLGSSARSTGWQRARKGVFALVLLCVAGACAPQVTVHGYVPTQDDLSTIEPGVDTILSVEERLGRPASSGLLGENDWYYVQTTMSQLTYNPPRITDRTVLAIGFDEDGVVEDIQQYGLEDGRVINLSPRVTRTGGQRRNILLSLFGGLLNFDAESLIDR